VSRRSGASRTDLIPAAVVRELVDRNERRIDDLKRQLDQARAEADEAERRVLARSGTEPAPLEAAPTPPGGSPDRPRTTVVARPPAPGPTRRA